MTTANASRAPLRVLHVITDTDRRGAQVFASDLAAALVRRGHHLHTVALIAGEQSPSLDATVLGKRSRGPSSLLALRRAMAQADVSVAHGSATLLACSIAGLGRRRRFVYRQISDSKFWAASWVRRVRVTAYFRFPRRVVALSDGASATLQDYLRVPRHKIDVVPNGVPLGEFGPADVTAHVAARATLAIAHDAIVATYVGALVPEKGVADLIEAIRLVDNVVLLIAGDGAAADALKAQAGDMGGRVRFLGAVSNTHQVFAASDMVVLPSRGGDSMPATLIEAGLCALPSISTPVGSIEDVVVHDHTGLIVACENVPALAQAIATLRDDSGRRKQLGENAYQLCLARFEIDSVARSWESTLYAAISPPVA